MKSGSLRPQDPRGVIAKALRHSGQQNVSSFIVSSLSKAGIGFYLSDGWGTIDTAPIDGTKVIVYAPEKDGLPELVVLTNYHADAGWCVCTIREATHWRRFAKPAQ